MNGNEEPQFTDAVGKTVPRPFVPPQVASPINLLNPDRYEFYTFNEKGELIKRLMTLKEIQSIVANGNGALISGDNDPNESQSVILNTIPLTNTNHDSDTKVQDIVDNVQNVLSREMENNKNLSSIPHDLLDTPNVSSSWSMILPAIFGNTGDEILPQIPINMTPETEVIDTTSTTKKTTTTKRPISTKKPSPTATKKVPSTTTRKTTVTKLDQKIVQTTSAPSVSTTKRSQTKRPTSSNTTKKQQIVKNKPSNYVYRSTTRRPIIPVINDSQLIKETPVDETTKTVLITSRPYTKPSTTAESTTRSTPLTKSTTKKTTRKPTISNVQQKKNSTASTTIHKVPASSLIKDSHITKIEMKPVLVESKTEESKIEKTTRMPSTTSTSTISTISTTSESPSSMEFVKVETLPPTTKIFSKTPSSVMTSTAMFTESKTPTISPIVLITKTHPVSTQKQTTAEMLLTPIKLETFTTEKPISRETTTKYVIKETTGADAPSSEEIRQDLAISQIIGSLQNDNFNLNHLFKPFDDNHEMKEEIVTTTMTPSHVEESTLKVAEKISQNINHVPDKVYIDNQLYLEEKEPIIKDIPTEAPATKETITIENEPTAENFVGTTTTSNSKEDSISLIENSEVMQTIEKLLQEQNKSKNKINADKIDILGFDDDDETEIKLAGTLNKKKNITQSEFIMNAATIASTINTKVKERSTTTEMPVTTAALSEESDTTISTILSEALSNVIEQMIKEQEFRKTSVATTSTEPSVTTTKTTPEGTEPSLDELNKLLYHYQDLSSKHDEMQSLSLIKEQLLTTTQEPEALETTTTMPSSRKDYPIIEEKSSMSLQNEKIYSEIDSTTAFNIEETTTTDDPTTQEFTTFFYVSDGSEEETTDNLGTFTTEQFVTSEKKISERKNEAFTTTYPPLTESLDEENNDTEEIVIPTDLVSNILDSIGLSSNSEEEDEEEDNNTSTEKNLKSNVDEEDNPSESEESDEVVSAISKISSTLDKTIKTDLNNDFSFTSNIANSLIAVADTISDTLNGDTESEENTDTILRTTVIPIEESTTQKAIKEDGDEKKNMPLNEQTEHSIEMSSEAFQDTTTEYSLRQNEEEATTEKVDEMTTLETFSEEDVTTPVTFMSPTKKLAKFPIKNNKHKESGDIQLEKDDSSPMIQLSIIRKEDSLEEINIMTPAIPTSTKIPITEGNFIKIESIDISTTTSTPNLNDTKNNNKTHENAKPTIITQRATTTAKSSALPEIIPSQAPKILLKEKLDDVKSEEPVTERVPLIEKATKDIMTSAPLMMASDENMVQIQVQTKPPPIAHSASSIRTTIDYKAPLVNAQNIKNSIKNSQFLNRPASQTIDLSPNPSESLGLAASTANLNSDLSDFSKLCNELAFTFWKSITADGISQSRSVVISPFALTSTLSMIFLGARGQTSGEMNDLLRLDDTVTFNPHVVFRNISESVEQSRNSGIAAAAFARELYSDRSKGKILPYFKEKAQQFYGAHVEEVNFNVVNDILRRRTNLLVKRHTYNKIKEYLKTNNIWVNEPLAAVSANIFMVRANLTKLS